MKNRFRGAMVGMACVDALGQHVEFKPRGSSREPLHPKIAAIASGAYKAKASSQISGVGYCVATLEAALWAFSTTDTFEDGAVAVVNLGDDSDSTGAVYGQLAGASYGYENIPSRWRENLVKKELVLDFADRLFALFEELH